MDLLDLYQPLLSGFTSSAADLYQPLLPGWTRVVQVIRCESQLPILKLFPCRLVPNDVGTGLTSIIDSQPQQYTCLSYTWEDLVAKSTLVPLVILTVDGHSHVLMVTPSLRDALLQLPKHVTADTWFLWVDQISIDQSSLDERAVQIRMMKQIYETASMVLVWLGAPGSDTDLAITTLNDIQNTWLQATDSRDQQGLTVDETDAQLMAISKQLAANISETAWIAIRYLMRRPWFGRAWIRQEATALDFTHVLVICGEFRVDFRAFLALATVAASVQLDLVRSIPLEHVISIREFSDLRRKPHGAMPLLRLVNLLHGCRVTDPKDLIYCMVGFATDAGGTPSAEFAIDYSESTEATYTRFAVWCIANYRNLDILSYCNKYAVGRRRALGRIPNVPSIGMPSWVPNWARPPPNIPFPKAEYMQDPLSQPLFNAGGQYVDHVPTMKPDSKFSTATHLVVYGAHIATVKRVLDPYVKDAKQDLSCLKSWMPSGQDQGEEGCLLNDIAWSEVFAKTVFLDTTVLRDENPPRLRRGAEGTVSLDSLTSHQKDEVRQFTDQRSLFYTSTHWTEISLMGLGPGSMEAEDEIFMLKGGRLLYVLRPAGYTNRMALVDVTGSLTNAATELEQENQAAWDRDESYKLVGECFMLGLVDGELLDIIADSECAIPAPLEDMELELRKIYIE